MFLKIFWEENRHDNWLTCLKLESLFNFDCFRKSALPATSNVYTMEYYASFVTCDSLLDWSLENPSKITMTFFPLPVLKSKDTILWRKKGDGIQRCILNDIQIDIDQRENEWFLQESYVDTMERSGRRVNQDLDLLVLMFPPNYCGRVVLRRNNYCNVFLRLNIEGQRHISSPFIASHQFCLRVYQIKAIRKNRKNRKPWFPVICSPSGIFEYRTKTGQAIQEIELEIVGIEWRTTQQIPAKGVLCCRIV